jgi:hypothetical protein
MAVARARWSRFLRDAIANKDAIFVIFDGNFIGIDSFTRAFFFCRIDLIPSLGMKACYVRRRDVSEGRACPTSRQREDPR